MAAFLVSRVLDGLDGALARLRGSTDWGAYLDIVCDFIVYVSIPVGFGLSDPAYLQAALLLCASFTLTGVSFLAFAAVAEKRGVTAHERAKKGFLYSRGIAEGGETILAFVLFCLFPSAFPMLATVFAALCVLTAVQRSLLAYAIFHERAERSL
jgi:phosphatidylglycerophosphate synthase